MSPARARTRSPCAPAMLAQATRRPCHPPSLHYRRAAGAAGMWRRGWRPLAAALRCSGARRAGTPREPHHIRSYGGAFPVRARTWPGSCRAVGPTGLSSVAALRGGSGTCAGSTRHDPGLQDRREVSSRASGREQDAAAVQALGYSVTTAEGAAGGGNGQAGSGGVATGRTRDVALSEGPAGGADPAGMQGRMGAQDASTEGADRTEQAGRSSRAEPALEPEDAQELPRAPWLRDAGQASTSSAAGSAGMRDSAEQPSLETGLQAARDGRAADRFNGVRSARAAVAWREDDSDSEDPSGSGVGSEEDLELAMRRTSAQGSGGVGRRGYEGGAGSEAEAAADEAEDGDEEWTGEDEGADAETDESEEDGDGLDGEGALRGVDAEGADEAPGDLKARAAAQARLPQQ